MKLVKPFFVLSTATFACLTVNLARTEIPPWQPDVPLPSLVDTPSETGHTGEAPQASTPQATRPPAAGKSLTATEPAATTPTNKSATTTSRGSNQTETTRRQTTATTRSTSSGGNSSLSDFEREVAELCNAERAKVGLAALKTSNTALQEAASIRAQEIKSSFSHTRPNGNAFSSVLKECGVSYTAAGENIAYGQRTPAEVVEGWMNSSGHRANILNAQFTHIGVGYSQTYWVQVFIR